MPLAKFRFLGFRTASKALAMQDSSNLVVSRMLGDGDSFKRIILCGFDKIYGYYMGEPNGYWVIVNSMQRILRLPN